MTEVCEDFPQFFVTVVHNLAQAKTDKISSLVCANADSAEFLGLAT